MDEELLKLRTLVMNHLTSAGGKTDWRNSCIDHLENVEKSCRKRSVAAVIIDDNIKGLTAALKFLLKNEPSSLIKGYGETTKKIIELAKLKKRDKRIPSTPVQYSAQGYTSTPPPQVQHSAQGYTSTPPTQVQHSAQGYTSTPPPQVQHSSQGYTSTPPTQVQHSAQGYTSTPPPQVQHSAQGYTSTPPPQVQHSAQGYTSTPQPQVQYSAQGYTSTPPTQVQHSAQGYTSTPPTQVQHSAQGYTSTPPTQVQHSAQGYTSTPQPQVQHSAQGKRHTKRNIEEIILDWVNTVLISEKTQTEDEYRLQSEIPTTHTSFFRSFKGLIDQVKEKIIYLNGKMNDMEVKFRELLQQKEQSERSLKGTATKSAVDEHQKRAMRDMREQLDKALKEKDHLQLRLSAENTELKEKLKKYEKRKKSIKYPLSQAQAPITRLGQETGIQLAYDNQLTSDANKIGEKYSDLFDNSWVDAIENLMKDRKDEKEEEKCLGVLKDILLKCYSFCKWRSEEQIAQMETILFIPDHRDDFFKREKVPSLCQEFVSDCVEFCWYMVIQEPPMVLYVGDEKSGSKIDIEKFKFYTRSGKLLDFVVWPALQLHADGPILRKGVVQPQA